VYLIVVKFTTKPEWTERWLELVGPFTRATRAEPGNLWFEWNRSVEEPDTFTLVEAFADDGAAAHVNSDHFAEGLNAMRPALARTPAIVSRKVDGSGWDEMGELQID
jgi:quinol monooxygenase YgiN